MRSIWHNSTADFFYVLAHSHHNNNEKVLRGDANTARCL